MGEGSNLQKQEQESRKKGRRDGEREECGPSRGISAFLASGSSYLPLRTVTRTHTPRPALPYKLVSRRPLEGGKQGLSGSKSNAHLGGYDDSGDDLGDSWQTLYSWEDFFVRGLVKFAPAVAYHFCPNLPATFSQPRTKKFSQLCIFGVTRAVRNNTY